MPEQVVAWLINAGPVGVFCIYVIWRQQRDDKVAATERADRLAVDRDRVATDKALAASLATLAERINQWSK